MKSILISNPVWGEFNCNVFCNYSLKSLLSPGNIPKLLKKDYKIILHILTRSNDKHIFLNNKNFNKIPKNVAIEFHYIKKIYKNKYKNVTALQNISIKRSLKEKFIVFNYADFFWSDCSLNNTIKTIEKEKINFLSYFCLPVDFKSAKKFITSNKLVSIIKANQFALKNLHRETKLRFWDSKSFTETPTFILFKVSNQGFIVRAYHQTILVAKINSNKSLYNLIRGNSLDEYFSSILENENYNKFHDTQKIFVFAMCNWSYNTALKKTQKKNLILRNCFQKLNSSHRKLALNPIIFKKYKKTDKELFAKKLNESREIIESLNKKYPVNKILYFVLTNRYFGFFSQIIIKLYNKIFD